MQSHLPFVSDHDADILSSQVGHTSGVKVINDPIHGHFELPPHVVSVLDTPHVQRLRDLKQLGGTYFVFPGASHNRFEHSLGVSHLSAEFITSMYYNSRDPFAREGFDGARHFAHAVKLVELAGLCHDLGHGPYSHMFDNEFLPAVFGGSGGKGMEHEERSVMMFEHLVEEYAVDIGKDDVRHIGRLIRGEKETGVGEGLTPAFLFDVVANGNNGIDTDKFDYLARDVHNVGLRGAYGFDYRRLMKFAKVVDDSICFHRKELFNVYHLFLTRFQLHRTVYNHRAAVSIDTMITDSFLQANSTFKISNSVNDPVEFLTMTDTLVRIIERSKETHLTGARKILHRLRTRRLYRFVDEVLLHSGVSRSVAAEDITTCQDAAGTGVDLVPSDIHVAVIRLHFGMKSQNPVENVLFFNDWEDQNPSFIPTGKASYVIPVHFEEKLLRIYVKREEKGDGDRVKNAVKVAFRRFVRSMNLGASVPSPVLAKRRYAGDLAGVSASHDDAVNCVGSARSPPKRAALETVASSGNDRIEKRSKPEVGTGKSNPGE